jgi:hypothetical protein
LQEELEIDCQIGELFFESNWQLEDKQILLKTYQVITFEGEIKKHVHSQLKWADPARLQAADFLPADRPVVDKLTSGRDFV